jgi:predicted RNA binding protein YcfA (HicA-like mRNA interferase family)
VSKLPRVSGRECVRALGKVGFRIRRQEGSHIVLRRDDPFAQVVVPDHRELDRGTLRAILRAAAISVDDFVALLG